MALHKPAPGRAILLLGAGLALVHPARGQEADTLRIQASDFAIGAVAGTAFLIPIVLDIEPGGPGCLPCDRSSVPFFDRWSITAPRDVWHDASTVLVLGLAGATWLDLGLGHGRRWSHAMASAEAAALATGLTELLKPIVARNRPVLYTEAALALESPAGQRRSWPSGHTAVAFAVATSYALSRTDSPARYAALAAALAVGALRVVAARHFPSDALSGAALGIGAALVVHEVRF